MISCVLNNTVRHLPPNIGLFINRIPYEYRPILGKLYRERKNQIVFFDNASVQQKQNFIFSNLKSLVEYSYSQVPFYNIFYNTQNFHPDQLRSFADIQRIPIITKSILKEFDIEERSSKRKWRYIVNTGGSSGVSFSLYIEPTSIAHEWAHMHTIWEKLNYKSSDLKLTFIGRSDLKKSVVEYDILRNSFHVDTYSDYNLIADKIKMLLKKNTIKYLHGYPSLIYEFALYCDDKDIELKNFLSENLQGAFLSSEFPHNHYREKIENVFNIPTISWYGHTERTVLAYEKHEKFLYEPFQTYGFAEAVLSSEGDNNLIATGYYNYASPLIRYNTEDVISDIKCTSGILDGFMITKGRNGEFVIDKEGKKISLTALVFGRHHKIFNSSKFIQIKQVKNGEIEIHFVSDKLSIKEAENYFDKRNLNMDLKFIKRSEPYRTKSGKIHLLIR